MSLAGIDCQPRMDSSKHGPKIDKEKRYYYWGSENDRRRQNGQGSFLDKDCQASSVDA